MFLWVINMYLERIQEIQNYIKTKNIDAYICFLSDDHGSEYIPEAYKSLSFLCGFTGSSGTLLITQSQSFLWTDGRYFLQAEKQLKESQTILKKSGIDEPIDDFINQNVATLAFDFKVCNISFIEKLKKSIHFVDDASIIHEIWKDKPSLPNKKIFLLPKTQFKLQSFEKCHKTITFMRNTQNFGILVTALDDIAWLLNARGKDIYFNPVFISFLFLSKIKNQETYTLYIPLTKLSKEIKEEFSKEQIIVKPYNDIYKDIQKFPYLIYYDNQKTNYKLYTIMQKKKNTTLWPTLQKAIKNNLDIQQSKKIHIYDGMIMCKFIYYLKNNVGKKKMTELSVATYLDTLRKQNGAFDLSFQTIVGYQENGAIIHYSATKESDKEIKNEGFLLVDSGGQYYFGTTDVTRTIAFKKITPEMKYHFTLALKAHIDLAMAVFDKNTTDAALDNIARKPLWDVSLDYNHGTGHGVGHMLNVHEGPQSIRYNKVNPVVMEKGMITSDEPGLYFEGKYGIRHENELLCVAIDENLLGFEPLTYVPFDLEAIDVTLLTKKERDYLNHYHQMVYRNIAKYLTNEEKYYLAYATREI